MQFKRRISKTPQELGLSNGGAEDCPDLWELTTGDYAAVGLDVTGELAARLPEGVKVGPHERVVLVPRSLLASAKPNIAD